MNDRKFNPAKIDKLNDPERIKMHDPDLLWKILDLDQPRILVDIGAGTGFFALPFSDKLDNGKVYACDIEETMIAWMQQNIPRQYRTNVIPMKMQENRVDLQDEIADLVYMINLHHELNEPLKLLAETRRLLKPGGTVMIVDWKKTETGSGPPLSIRVSSNEVEKQLERMGFEEITAHPLLPYHFVIVAQKS